MEQTIDAACFLYLQDSRKELRPHLLVPELCEIVHRYGGYSDLEFENTVYRVTRLEAGEERLTTRYWARYLLNKQESKEWASRAASFTRSMIVPLVDDRDEFFLAHALNWPLAWRNVVCYRLWCFYDTRGEQYWGRTCTCGSPIR